jgi:IclR family mhp operon transcriptional activator
MQAKPIRAFARGLAVLEALNRAGSATALELARRSGVPRATVYRLLRTLEETGYVGRSIGDERFQLLLKVRRLSSGFRNEQWLSEIAVPRLLTLTERISWPCDVSTLQGLTMVIRDTTHGQTPLSIDRDMIGRNLPLLGSATGLAYIAFAPPAERALLLELLARSEDPVDAVARRPAEAARLIATTQKRGYGARHGGVIWPHTGAIALPVRHADRVLGCISTIWMGRFIPLEDGIARCLEPLRETLALIEHDLREQQVAIGLAAAAD